MLVQDAKIDPRVKRTRQLLQSALMELAREKPLDGITVQDIAARAEVNRATFYAHFEDKYALLNYTARETFRAMLDEKLPDHARLNRNNLRLLIVVTCQYLGDFIGRCTPATQMSEHAMMSLQVQTYLYELLLDWLSEAVDGKSNSGLETAAMTTSWAIWGAVFQWSRSGRKLASDRLVEQILTLLDSGLHSYLREESRA